MYYTFKDITYNVTRIKSNKNTERNISTESEYIPQEIITQSLLGENQAFKIKPRSKSVKFVRTGINRRMHSEEKTQ